MQTIIMTLSQGIVDPGVAMALGLRFIVALLEGLDLQSIGVAAPYMVREFGLSIGQMGPAFSAGASGLLPGAMLGGRLADCIDRKRVPVLATALFGTFSIAAAHMWDFNSPLITRMAIGTGLGIAIPNLIALYAEAVPACLRNIAVSVMYCDIPFGGATAAMVDISSADDSGWRYIFYVGGFSPLVMVSLLLTLQESRRLDNAQRGAVQPPPVPWTLFGERRTAATLFLWANHFFTLIALYFLLNWLPSLMAVQGLSQPQVDIVQVPLNIGDSTGTLGTGILMGAVRPRRVVSGMYVGIIATLSLLAAAGGMASMSTGVSTVRLFAVGTQSVLYALAAAYYLTAMRDTGVGAAMTAGRLGSIAGPPLAGQLLAMGQYVTAIIGASIPVTIIAALAVLLLLEQPRAQD